ncbi:MAG: Gfo/Idh/MocA family oxidoreductase [Elusimicrobiota bacterium]
MRNSKSSVLVIGSGELGSRHLQAICQIPYLERIDVLDQRIEALNVARSRVESISNRNKFIEYQWIQDISKISSQYDLIVVATQATERVQIIKELIAKNISRKFFIEKVVAQSTSEYESLLSVCEKNNIKIWVNLKSRLHPSHLRVKQKLNSEEKIVFHVLGGNHGLGNNGVHVADLFIYFSNQKKINLQKESIDLILHRSKRSNEIFDLSGELYGNTDKGDSFFLSFQKDNLAFPLFYISSASYRAIVDDSNKWMLEATEAGKWKWEPYNIDKNIMVSELSTVIVSDILTKQQCSLPLLDEAYGSHQFILDALHPTFKKLIKNDLELCPIT